MVPSSVLFLVYFKHAFLGNLLFLCLMAVTLFACVKCSCIIFITKCEFVDKKLEEFLDLRILDVHVDQFSKIMLSA
jgi:hypothetical protein